MSAAAPESRTLRIAHTFPPGVQVYRSGSRDQNHKVPAALNPVLLTCRIHPSTRHAHVKTQLSIDLHFVVGPIEKAPTQNQTQETVHLFC